VPGQILKLRDVHAVSYVTSPLVLAFSRTFMRLRVEKYRTVAGDLPRLRGVINPNAALVGAIWLCTEF
jgi:hypothetical protein